MSHYNAVTKVNTKTAAETAEFVVNLPRKKRHTPVKFAVLKQNFTLYLPLSDTGETGGAVAVLAKLSCSVPPLCPRVQRI